QALTLCRHGDDDSELVRCDLLTALCDAQRRSGSHVWRETAAKAVAVARRVGDPVRLARAALGHARPSGLFANGVTVDHDVIALYEEALAALGATGGSERARLLAQLAVELVLLPGECARRDAFSQEALAIARRLGDADVLAQTINARIIAAVRPHTLSERVALT